MRLAVRIAADAAVRLPGRIDVVGQHGPHLPGMLVGDGHDYFAKRQTASQRSDPDLFRRGLFSTDSLGPFEAASRALDQQGAQIVITAAADGAEGALPGLGQGHGTGDDAVRAGQSVDGTQASADFHEIAASKGGRHPTASGGSGRKNTTKSVRRRCIRSPPRGACRAKKPSSSRAAVNQTMLSAEQALRSRMTATR